MISKIPYDSSTHHHPWLINTNVDEAIIGPEGLPLTAETIWEKKGQDREDLVQWVYRHYRSRGFVQSSMSDAELLGEFRKLVAKDPNSVINKNGEISNSSTLCNDVCRHFVWDKYFSARNSGNSKSVKEVFESEALLDVLRNRMGYCLSNEDGEERPYVFALTDKMVLQGIRSTGLGSNISLFKPIVGKYIYSRYAKKRVFDYSAGWGARCLAALSLGLEYYATDPLTALEMNSMVDLFCGKGKVVDGGSEDPSSYAAIPKVDCIMSCPPYFDKEIYADNTRQSINKFPAYLDWLTNYWSATVDNCLGILDDGGTFILVMVDSLGKTKLLEDMSMICESKELCLVESIPYRTSTSHLSHKRKTGKASKMNEFVLVFKRK